MLDQIKEVLINAIHVEEEKIKPEAKLREDLDIDSLSAVELALELETSFDIRIEDEELVAQFPQLKKIYNTLYSVGDLEDVITELSPGDMKATILSLPKGAQDSIKHLASKMVSDGRLDSVRKIKVLDEIFDTEMSIMTGLFN